MDNFECLICYEVAKDHLMCLGCQKFFCKQCLQTAYATSSDCPHCRVAYPLESYVHLKFFDEIQSNAQMARLVKADKCPNPTCVDKLLTHYCQTCDVTCCGECGVSDHNHDDDNEEPDLKPVEWRRHIVQKRLKGNVLSLGEDIAVYGNDLLRDVQTLRQQKDEGNRMMTLLMRDMADRFNSDIEAQQIKLEAKFAQAKTMFLKANSIVGKVKDASESQFLNRLVDIDKTSSDELQSMQDQMDEARGNYEPLQLDSLSILRPWLPYWELRTMIQLARPNQYEVVKGRLRTWEIRRVDELSNDRITLRIKLVHPYDHNGKKYSSFVVH